eukprot:SAG31_NODE_2626_length_5353_cov_5.529692_3_plen_58_part_00
MNDQNRDPHEYARDNSKHHHHVDDILLVLTLFRVNRLAEQHYDDEMKITNIGIDCDK